MPKVKHVWVIMDTWTDYDGWPIADPTIWGNRVFDDFDEASDRAKKLQEDYRAAGQTHSVWVKDLVRD